MDQNQEAPSQGTANGNEQTGTSFDSPLRGQAQRSPVSKLMSHALRWSQGGERKPPATASKDLTGFPGTVPAPWCMIPQDCTQQGKHKGKTGHIYTFTLGYGAEKCGRALAREFFWYSNHGSTDCWLWGPETWLCASVSSSVKLDCNNTYFIKLLWELTEIIYAKHSAQFLAHTVRPQ